VLRVEGKPTAKLCCIGTVYQSGCQRSIFVLRALHNREKWVKVRSVFLSIDQLVCGSFSNSLGPFFFTLLNKFHGAMRGPIFIILLTCVICTSYDFFNF
jgi:hypothetical protein